MRTRAFRAPLALALSIAGAAQGQPAPATSSAAPASSSAPAPAAAPTPGPAPAAATAAPTPASAPTATDAAPAPGATPPGYYVEPAPPPTAPEAGPPGPPIFEPPAPGGAPPVFEPPPPPVPRHVAPRVSLWLGARLGWFVPFGSAYAQGVLDQASEIPVLVSVPWRDYVSSGPSFELDAGARISRNYNVFALWERAELGSGRAESQLRGGQTGGDTDFFALGLRATSNPDRLGFITEISVGYRQARATWNDGTEYRMTGGVLEGRIGIGADIRFNPMLTLSPLLSVGVGSFDRFRVVAPGGASYDRMGPNDAPGGHGWVGLSVGGHVDLFGTK
jgi:hypothetical protein